MRVLTSLFHYTAYYLAWFICVYSASLNAPFAGFIFTMGLLGCQITLQILQGETWRAAAKYALILASLGAVTDTIWIYTHLLSFHASPWGNTFAPLWMMALWLSFGFNVVLLYRQYMRHTFLWAVLALVAFPFAYWLGVKFGAAYVLKPTFFYPLLGITWAVLLPLSFKSITHPVNRGG